MARFSRIHVATQMNQQGLVPIFYRADLSLCKSILKACYQGGARVVEFTNRGDHAHETFSELTRFAARELPDLVLGAGSITDGATASLFMQVGADFIVSPVLREDIATTCNRRKVLWSPGCSSPTEIARAEELGAEIVKLFPASQLGPDFIKAVKGPCPWTSIMPTGGVTTDEKDLKAWFDAGATCVGIGSQLLRPKLLQDNDFTTLETEIRKTLAVIQEIRSDSTS